MAGITTIDLNNSEDVDETFASDKSSDPDIEKFDRTIGLIEDMIMDNEFRSIQENFVLKYANEFDPKLDENKLIYTDIHKEYLLIIESFILNKIKRFQSNFNLDRFMKQLESRQDQLEEEIFEFLLTFTDFLAFKQWMIDHRRSTTTSDINPCLQSARGNNPTSLLDQVHVNDESCLDLGITGTKIKKPQDQKNK